MSKDEFQYFKGSHNPMSVFQSLHFDSQFYQANPDFFHPCGIWLFCGSQGSGKTLSAVKTAKKLLAAYPKAIFCSNLDVHGIDRPIIPFTDYSLIGDLENAEKGVVFLIDELQILFNSLESKQIPISEIANFCQMRKVRRVILGSSQVYGRVAKPIREQLKYAILCKSYFKYLQVNRVIDPNGENSKGEKDGELDGEHVFTSWFFHKPEDYQAYDTYTKIARIDRKGVIK